MIVGADRAERRRRSCATSARLYGGLSAEARLLFRLQPDPGCVRALLPLQAPPLMREHRLYQADWLHALLRLRGRRDRRRRGRTACSTSTSIRSSPGRCANRDALPGRREPRAARDAAARAGPRRARRSSGILAARRHRRLRLDDLARLARVADARLQPFIVAARLDARRGCSTARDLRARLAPPPRQLDSVLHEHASRSRSSAADDVAGWRDARARAAGARRRARRQSHWRVAGEAQRPVRSERRADRRSRAHGAAACAARLPAISPSACICHRDPDALRAALSAAVCGCRTSRSCCRCATDRRRGRARADDGARRCGATCTR